MAINRVDLADETLIDISDSTVSADTLASGEIAYGADGEQIVGIAEFGGNTKDCYKTTDTASTSIADTDYIPLSDANGNKKKSTWSNIKTVLGNVFALKNNTVIIGSLSMGRKADTTIGANSVALGYNCEASGHSSHAEGNTTTASGTQSHAEGYKSTASGRQSHVEGYETTASDSYGHAEGFVTTASGICSHAEGNHAVANGKGSHAEGCYTKVSFEYQHVQGKYNEEDTEGNYAHIVGNGNSDSARKDIHRLAWTGDAWYAGDVESATAGKLSKKTTHHFGYIQSGYASTQYKVASLSSGDIVPEDGSYTETTFNVHDGDLITLQSESNNTYSATADSPIYITIDEVNYKVVYYNNAVATGTNTAYYGAGNRNITYRIDTIRRLAHFFSKDWDNNTTYNFKTAYNSSTNKAVTESDLKSITNGVGTTLDVDSGNINIATAGYHSVGSITIPKGIYSVSVRCEFAKSSSADDFRVGIGTQDSAISNSNILGEGTMYARGGSSTTHPTTFQLGCCEVFESETTVYANFCHNHGSALQCRAWYCATKIANL